MAYDSLQRLLALGTKEGTIFLYGKHSVEFYFTIYWDEENPQLALTEDKHIIIDELVFAQNRPYLLALISKKEMRQNFVFVNQFLYVFDLKCRQVRYNMQIIIPSSLSPDIKHQNIRITALYVPMEGNIAYLGTSVGTIYFFNFVEGLLSSFSIPTISTTTTLPVGMSDITCMTGHPQFDRTVLLLGYKNGEAKVVEFNGTSQKDIKMTTFAMSTASPSTTTSMISVKIVCWHPTRDECLVSYSNGVIATYSKGKGPTNNQAMGPIALFESFKGSHITDVYFLNQGTELLINAARITTNQNSTGMAGLFLLKLKDFKTISQTIKLHSNEIAKALPLVPLLSTQPWKYLGVISVDKNFYIVDCQNDKFCILPSFYFKATHSLIEIYCLQVIFKRDPIYKIFLPFFLCSFLKMPM